MNCIFSVDVEDWFHLLDLPSTPPLSEWDSLPSRVEGNFARLLEMFAAQRVHVTCFFLGWIAEKYPHLVREAQKAGHEVASHGHAHKLVYQSNADEFFADILAAKKRIEDVTGTEVIGYRAPGFSVTQETPWFFERLAEAGYRYDSSIFPATRGHGGMKGAEQMPHLVRAGAGQIVEFPITVLPILKKRVCLFGGGYLRLAPWPAIKCGAASMLKEGHPVVFYLHPREIDPDQPRLRMGYVRRFKSYVNLSTTEAKVRRILAEFQFTTFREFVETLCPSKTTAAGAGQ